MQAWAFPSPTLVPNKTNMAKDNTLSQSLNNRLSDDPVFFVYDHNMLKKEEDDLKDAILYFSPEYMSADDQCALCGQLMGMAEFLSASISQSTPLFFKFDQEKFALKRIGSYSFGLQASVCIPDSTTSEQLMSLYEVFVTFHGSVDSVRLRFKESHSHFLQEFSNIWRVILQVSNVSLHSTLSQTFSHIPSLHLPKSGSHLFLQASHLLQASQRRPFVLAGAIFYKNKVLCTQLSPVLTRHLTFLQNQIPYIARNTETDMPKGCKIITLFLTDNELKQITPLHINTNRHCKSTNFYRPPKPKINISDQKPSRKLTRRLTCSSVPTLTPEKSMKAPPGNIPADQTLKRYLTKDQFKSYYGKHDAIGVEQSSWGKNKSKVHLSHVPLVECQAGESPSADEGEISGDPISGQNYNYQQTELSQHLASFTVRDTRASTSGQTETHPGKVSASGRSNKALTVETDVHDSSNENVTGSDKSELKSLTAVTSKHGESRDDCESKVGASKSGSAEVDPEHVVDEETTPETGNVEQTSNITEAKTNTDTKDPIEDTATISDLEDDESAASGVTQIDAEGENSKITKADIAKEVEESKHIKQVGANSSDDGICLDRSETEGGESKADTISDVQIIISESQTDLSDTMNKQVDGEDRVDSILHVLEDSVAVSSLVSESELETEDEMEVVVDSFTPCITCLDLNAKQSDQSESNLKQKCAKCLAQPSIKHVIAKKTGERQEVMDFGLKQASNDSDSDEPEAESDVEGRHFYSAKSEAPLDKAALSSFSSDVSTDSTISRYWTHEMEGLNDVTLYVQCHSEISLMLIMENPEQYQENLFHALWKGSLAHLADLDYYVMECIEGDGNSNQDASYKYAKFDTYSAELLTNIEDSSVKRKQVHLQQMLNVIHADFKDRHCLTDVTLRSQSSSCYGHHRHGDETYFQSEFSSRSVSGLPTPKDPAFNLDVVARQRLSKDKKMTFL